MHFIVLETSDVYVATLHVHFALMTHVALPQALELRPICPRDYAIPFSLACLPLAFVLGLFVVATSHRRQAVVVIHCALATRSSIFKVSSILVTVFVVHHTQPIQTPIQEGTSLYRVGLFLQLDIASLTAGLLVFLQIILFA